MEVPTDYVRKWQRILNLSAKLLRVPVALIMRIVGEEIEVFVASEAGDNPYQIGHREELADSGLYCETVIRTLAELHVPDALADDNWKDNPDVPLGMIAYFGLPIVTSDGQPFGTICMLDRRPREFLEPARELLSEFRNVVQDDLALAAMNQELGEENKRLTDYLAEIKTLRGILPICANCKSIRNDEGYWQQVELYLQDRTEVCFSHGICPKCERELYGDSLAGEQGE